MNELPAYVAQIEPGWIDYNGHLRDAYYCVVMSFAVDDMMEHLGLDAAYRERTHCTLYTVELHMHYFHEIKATDRLTVSTAGPRLRSQAHSRRMRFSLPPHRRPGRDGRAHVAARTTRREAERRLLSCGNREAARESAALAGSGREARCRLAQDRAQAPLGPMPASDIRRLIAPRSIALIGASAWTDAVAAGNATIGYRGTVWRVHPTRASTPERPFYRSIAELPGVPDAAFIAVPNHEAPGVAGALAARGAGGFVCFSSGFGELGTELGRRLNGELLEQAGDLPFFGPNCYGFVNFFDRAAMLPDQIVGEPLERGVALICQSGTISLSLSFNERSVPIGYLFSVGNQSRLAVEDLIEVLCDDPRVTAFGLYLEGIKDAERFATRRTRRGAPASRSP